MNNKNYIYVVYQTNPFGGRPYFFNSFKIEEEAKKEALGLSNNDKDIYYVKVELI